MTNAMVAMAADIDGKHVLRLAGTDFVGAQQKQCLQSGIAQNAGNAAICRQPEIEPADPRRRRVQHVPAVPAFAPDVDLFGQRPRRRHHAGGLQRRHADNDRRALGLCQRIGNYLGQLADQRRIIAQPFDRIGQIKRRADAINFRLAPRCLFAQPHIEQRCLTARIGADEQHDVGVFNPGNARIEQIIAAIGAGEQRAILPAFNPC